MIIETTKTYNKSLKNFLQRYSKKRRSEINADLTGIISKIANDTLTPQEIAFYHIHDLTGDKQNISEFHYGGDVCVEYILTDDKMILVNIGSHSYLSLGNVIKSTIKRLYHS